MNRIKETFKNVSKQVWLGVLALLISIIIIIFASTILYQRTVGLLTENLRERILTISVTVAANINAADLEALQVEDDWKKPEWAHVVNRLHNAKYSNENIVFMYIFRKKYDDPTKIEFIADADSIDPYANMSDDPSRYVDVNRDGIVESDGADKLQWPGQDYPEAADIPETFEAYNGPLTSKDLYTDSYGTVLTGYAPIKDENGNTVAVLATDIKADDFFTITRQTLTPFFMFIVFLTLIISTLVIVIIYSWRKYAESLANLLKQRESLVHLITHKVKSSFTRSKIIFACMLDGTFGAISPEIKKRAEQGLESDNTGINTVDLVLNVSNLQKGAIKYDFKNFDFKELVLKTVSEKKISAEEKGLKLETKIERGDRPQAYNIMADPLWLKEVIVNLIENSIKYTEEGKITVALEDGNGKIKLSVKDTGIGITDEDKKNLFTEGGRGKNSVRMNVDSTGYGLYSVKLIIEAHKGKVWMEPNKDGRGSVFFVELSSKEIGAEK